MEFLAGINPKTNIGFFTTEEQEIIAYLATRDWYVTRTESVKIAGSSYKVILMKPSDLIKNAFNINREIVVAFSPYETFEPRSIDAIDYLDIQELRLEEICSIIISRDSNVEIKLSSILKTNQQSRVIVPFSYDEILSNKSNPDYLINKLRNKFYGRDLFGIQDPLEKDLYFFGRKDLVLNLLNRHLNGENSGVFGLRKTGKTSILYSIGRALDRKKSVSIYIDCQTLHLKSWITALFSIIQELQEKTGVKKSELKTLSNELTSDFISDYFLEDIKTIYKKNDKKSILLVFDEIENITFDTSISENWKNGVDFIKFWNVIRSSYHKHRSENIFTFLITGTNPRCVEVPTINKVDNPIFSQFTPIYIPAFDFTQTKEMLDKLGGYMGLKFDDNVCSRLVIDFGGHPLLIRQMCSYIHRNVTDNRPFIVTKTYYDLKKGDFYLDEQGFTKYVQMVLEVLDNWYKDELQMLTWLSIDDYETFKEYANGIPEYVTHLKQYGIIEKSGNDYGFKIEALKTYLSNKNKYKKLTMTNDEKWEEIGSRRRNIELKLRKFVKQTLKQALGEEAKKKVILELYAPNKVNQYLSNDYGDFFNPEKHDLYLDTLFELMRKHWEGCYRNIFETDVEEFNAKKTLINKYRNREAHTTPISDADFQSFRGAMEWLEQKLTDY